MKLDAKTLKRLRARLPYGYTKRVQENLSRKGIALTVAAISGVARGEANNEAVIDALIEVAESHEARVRELANRINNRRQGQLP